MLDRWLHAAARRPTVTMLAWGLFAACAGSLALRIHSAHEPRLFLPSDSPARHEFEAHADRIGGGDFVALGYEVEDVLGPESLRAVQGLHEELEQIPGVEEVRSLPGALRDHLSTENSLSRPLPAEMRSLLANHPDLSGNLLSTDRHAGALWATLSQAQASTMVAQVVSNHPTANVVHMAGPAMFRRTFDTMLRRDLLRVGPVTAGLLAGALFIAFKRWQAVIGSLAVICIGLLGAMLPMALFGQPITILNLVALPLVAVASLATSVHWLWAWRRCDGRCNTATSEVAAPCLWAALTTAVAVGSLVLTDFPALRWMGVSAAAGVAVSFPAALTILPSLMTTAHPTITHPRRPGAIFHPTHFPSRRAVCGFTALFVIAASAGLPSLSVESNIALALPRTTPLRQAEHWFEAHLGGLVPLEVIVEGGGAAQSNHAVDTLALLRAKPEAAVVRHPSDSQVFHATARFPEMPSSEMTATVGAIESRVRELWPSEYRVTVTGLVPLILDAMAQMLHSLATSLGLALAIIFVLMSFALRSVRWAAAGLVPNTLPILSVLGLMGWASRPVDLVTTSVGCAALGVAVDDTVHVLHRHRLAGSGSGDLLTTHRRIMTEVGPALLLTTVVSVLGFGTLAVATFEPLRWFGLWAAVALSLALVAALSLIPVVLSLLTPQGNEP